MRINPKADFGIIIKANNGNEVGVAQIKGFREFKMKCKVRDLKQLKQLSWKSLGIKEIE